MTAAVAPSRPLESLNAEGTARQGDMMMAITPVIQAIFNAVHAAAQANRLTDELVGNTVDSTVRTHFGHLSHPSRVYLASFVMGGAAPAFDHALTLIAKSLTDPWPSLST